MSTIKISELPALTTATDTIEFVINDSGASKKINRANILATVLKDADIGVSVSPAFLVGTPTITAPTTGAVDFNGEITASAYATIDTYTGTHDFTHWELSYTSDFAIIELESTTGNVTSWTPSVGVALQLCYVRVRYGSDSHLSGNSDSISFTTSNVFINTPTLTVEGTPTDVPEDPTLTTSAFSVANAGTDTHVSTDWEVIRDSDSVVVWSSLANTVDLLSIVVPAGLLAESIAYTFKARHTGTTYGSSAYASVEGTTVAAFAYDNYLSVGHGSSPFVTIYGNDVDTSTKLPDPATLPTGAGYGVAFSVDGIYMSVAHSVSPYVTNYKRSGDTFTKLANPATLPPDTGQGVAFSGDGVYMSVAHSVSPFVTIYKRSGDTFTKLANPATLPPNHGRGVAFSADGVYMSVAHQISPFVTIYKRSGDTFTKLADPTTLPSYNGNGVAFSADGIYMSVAHQSWPFVTIYKRSGDTFTKLADPTNSPTGTGKAIAFSADGIYLSVAHDGSPYLTIYKRSGDTFTKLANPATLPTGNGRGVAFSADGVYMSVVHVATPFVTIYKRSGDTFTKLANPASLPPNTGLGVAYYPGPYTL
jgi:6-phosphogluconolactonase (cycloisomerase 2 family)